VEREANADAFSAVNTDPADPWLCLPGAGGHAMRPPYCILQNRYWTAIAGAE
jgi:hypothetical protein